jgi:DNA polymerase
VNKNQLLKSLYEHKFFGFDYFDDIKPIGSTLVKSQYTASLDSLKDIVSSCHLCDLAKNRKDVVFGMGNIEARVIFIGDISGLLEMDDSGGFIGRSGEMLDRMITNVLGLKKNEVYITNVIKCVPNSYYTPTVDELNCCKPYLLNQIELVKPEVIITLGDLPYMYLTGDMGVELSKVRGVIREFGDMKLIPTYHPLYLLRNPSLKKDVLDDLKKVKVLL